MTQVVDLLTARAKRGGRVLEFDSPDDALAFASTQVRELQALVGHALLLSAEDLDLPLAQAAAIISEVRRLLAERSEHEAMK